MHVRCSLVISTVTYTYTDVIGEISKLAIYNVETYSVGVLDYSLF